MGCCLKNASVKNLMTIRLMPESEKGHQYILKLPTYVLDCLLAPEIYIRSYNVFALPNRRLFGDFVEVQKAFLSPLSLLIKISK